MYFIDSDDYLTEKNVLEKMYNKCEKENLDILIFDYFKDYGNKKEYIINLDQEENLLIEKNNFIMSVLDLKGAVSIWAKIIKRELFIKNKIKFPEDIFLGEDFVTTLKLAYFSRRIGKINEAFYNYVQHPNQGTKTISKEKAFEEIYLHTHDLIRFYQNKKDTEEYLKFIKLKTYYKFFKSKNKNIKSYKKLKEEFLKEDKKLYDCKFYKSWSLKKKIKFFIRTKLL